MLNDRHAQPLADPKLHENERNWTGGMPSAPAQFNFFHFHAKILPDNSFLPQTQDLASPVWEILDIYQIVSEVGSRSGLEGGNLWWSRLNVRNAN